MRMSILKHCLQAALMFAMPPGDALAATEAAPPAPKGSLVIIGGNLRPDNGDVWRRIVQLAGGKGARIGVFGSASINPEKSAQNTVN
ncbi:cyanophycinase, partial [Rugamonas sp. FT82W]|nr:cyanophycinase [Duganella vulcania]